MAVADRRRRLAALIVLAAALGGAAYAVDQRGGAPQGVAERPSPTTSAEPGPPTSTERSTTTTTTTTTTPIDRSTARPTDRFTVAPGGSQPIGAGPVRTYTVEVEDGISIDPISFAAAVDAILGDPRGWTAAGDVALQRVGPGRESTFRVRLAAPATVDAHCAPLETNGQLSCRQGADVMINLTRWLEGAESSELPLERYREYLISHEVGHALGHHHEGCPSPGAIAPVMLQQTKGLQGCRPNPWPFP